MPSVQGTRYVSLGTMGFIGSRRSLHGTVVELYYYVDTLGDPTIGMEWNNGSLEEEVAHESTVIDPHMKEGFRRARERGLIV